MSLWKKMTGKSWAKSRGIVAAVGGAIIGGALTGGLGAGILAGAALGASAGGTYAAADAQRQQAKAAKAAAKEAEALAGSGHNVDSAEAAATVDTAGNEAYKRKQKMLAAGLAAGRSGTQITSNLGGNSRLG